MRRVTIAWIAAAVFVVAEVWAIASVVGLIGGLWTLLALVGIALAGAALAKRQGRRSLASLRTPQRDASTLEIELGASALVLVGALLLIVPGFISDGLGLLFIVPVTRPLARRGLAAGWRWATKDIRDRVSIMEAKLDRDSVVEGERVDDPASGRPDKPNPDDPTVVRGEIER